MWFWIKHLMAAVVLLGLAFVLLFKPELINFNPDAAVDPKKTAKTSAAKEFTNFYEQLRYSLDATVDSSKEYVIKLKDTSDSLTSTLASRTNTVPALDGNWQGQRNQSTIHYRLENTRSDGRVCYRRGY